MTGIKIRVWDNCSQSFISPEKKKFAIRSDGSLIRTDGLACDPEYIPQFSVGLKDTGGKDIFEGDIVEYSVGDHYFREMVVYENFVWTTQSRNGLFSMPLSTICRYEVVGNIYQNLDLLPNDKI